MHYRTLLKETFHKVWHHKSLWFVGFFVALLGNGGEIEVILNNVSKLSAPLSGPTLLPTIFQSKIIPVAIRSISDLVSRPQTAILTIAIIVLFVFVIVIGFLAQGVLIAASPDIHHKDKKINLFPYITRSKKHLGEIILINFILRGTALLLASAIVFPIGAVIVSSSGSASWLALLFFLIITPLALISSFVSKFAVFRLVLKKSDSWIHAIGDSIAQLKNHWLSTIEFMAIMFIINIAIGTLFVFLSIIILFPLFSTILLLSFLELSAATVAVKIITAFLFISSLSLIGAALACFQYIGWIEFFETINEHGGESKTKQLFNQVLRYWKTKWR